MPNLLKILQLTGQGGALLRRLTPAVLLTALAAPAQLPPGARDTSQNPAQNSTRQSGQAPPDPQATARAAANDALEHRNYAGALKLLLPLAEQSPKDAQLLYDLAYTEDALDQTTNAEASYRAALTADPTLTEAHLGLGLLLARTAQPEARAELALAAQQPTAPAALRARALRAMARIDLSAKPPNSDAARDDLLAALKLSPETPEDTLMAAELAESAQDAAGAEKEYRRLLAVTPNDPAATVALAHLLARDRPGEAESLLTAALAAHPGDASLTAQLASLYASQQNFNQALPLAETLHTANPADADLTRLLAHLYAQAGQPAKAEPLFAALLAARPDSALMDDRADALIKLRRYAEAQALLERAVTAPAAFPTPEDFGIAASHLAFAAANNNDPETTLRALSLRATVLPQSPSALFLMATAYDKLHDFKHAADTYKEFLAAANGKFPDEEFEARHRLIAIEKRR